MLRRRRQRRPEASDPTDLANPLAQLSAHELVARHSKEGVNTHFVSEMLRRQIESSEALGNRIWWLNIWLLIFTVVIAGLTGALVWMEWGLRGALE